MERQSFKGRTILITGASRGIGKAIALRLAREGANIVIAAKSMEEDVRLGGTIYTAAEEVEMAGGQALAVYCDIRKEDLIQNAIDEAVAKFGRIDMLVNNASAIAMTNTALTEPKQLDLMFDINVRGTFLVTKACLPYLKESDHAHILTLSPPLNFDLKWLKPHIGYTVSKYSMSMMALGWSAEFKESGIASNTLWPVTTIATSAIQNIVGGSYLMEKSRKASIMADAAFEILGRPAAQCTGNFFTDEEVLRESGITDFSEYSINPDKKLQPDLFL